MKKYLNNEILSTMTAQEMFPEKIHARSNDDSRIGASEVKKPSEGDDESITTTRLSGIRDEDTVDTVIVRRKSSRRRSGSQSSGTDERPKLSRRKAHQ